MTQAANRAQQTSYVNHAVAIRAQARSSVPHRRCNETRWHADQFRCRGPGGTGLTMACVRR